MCLKDDIAEALLYNLDNCDDERFVFSKIPNGFRLEFGAMYSSPVTINFKTLTALSKIVGTDEINVDEFHENGCKTCDYGSDYGHKIDIINPTLRLDELEKLCE